MAYAEEALGVRMWRTQADSIPSASGGRAGGISSPLSLWGRSRGYLISPLPPGEGQGARTRITMASLRNLDKPPRRMSGDVQKPPRRMSGDVERFA
jgi:hypothetical protein